MAATPRQTAKMREAMRPVEVDLLNLPLMSETEIVMPAATIVKRRMATRTEVTTKRGFRTIVALVI